MRHLLSLTRERKTRCHVYYPPNWKVWQPVFIRAKNVSPSFFSKFSKINRPRPLEWFERRVHTSKTICLFLYYSLSLPVARLSDASHAEDGWLYTGKINIFGGIMESAGLSVRPSVYPSEYKILVSVKALAGVLNLISWQLYFFFTGEKQWYRTKLLRVQPGSLTCSVYSTVTRDLGSEASSERLLVIVRLDQTHNHEFSSRTHYQLSIRADFENELDQCEFSLSKTSPVFYLPAEQIFWKHCGKRRNCSSRAISPFPTLFSNLLENFRPF